MSKYICLSLFLPNFLQDCVNVIIFNGISENRICLTRYSLQQIFDDKHTPNTFTYSVNPLSGWELNLLPNFGRRGINRIASLEGFAGKEGVTFYKGVAVFA